MSNKANPQQKEFFSQLDGYSNLIISVKTLNLSVDLIGTVTIKDGTDDVIYIKNTSHHLHINWSALKYVSYDKDNPYQEGCLTFNDEQGIIFKIFNPSGDFNKNIQDIFATNNQIQLSP